MAKVPNAVKNIAENFNRLSMAHERYRRQTHGRQQPKTYEAKEHLLI